MHSILFVCSANVCRSPLAAAHLAHLLETDHRVADARVASAGVRARPGSAACEAVVVRVGDDPGALKQIGHHRSRRLNTEALMKAHLILTANTEQRGIASGMAPGSHRKVFTLLEAVELGEALHRRWVGNDREGTGSRKAKGTDFGSWVEALDASRGTLLAGVSPRRGRGRTTLRNDIPDGHVLGNREHRRTLDSVTGAIDRLAAVAPLWQAL